MIEKIRKRLSDYFGFREEELSEEVAVYNGSMLKGNLAKYFGVSPSNVSIYDFDSDESAFKYLYDCYDTYFEDVEAVLEVRPDVDRIAKVCDKFYLINSKDDCAEISSIYDFESIRRDVRNGDLGNIV